MDTIGNVLPSIDIKIDRIDDANVLSHGITPTHTCLLSRRRHYEQVSKRLYRFGRSFEAWRKHAIVISDKN